MERERRKAEKKNGQENAYYSATPKFGTGGPSRIRQHFNRGLTVFLIIAACILFYFALLRLPNLSDAAQKIAGVLRPVIFGIVIAYLLNPIVMRIDRFLIPFLKKYIKSEKRVRRLSRSIGVAVSLLFLVIIILMLCNLLIPELYASIRNMIYTLPRQLNQMAERIDEMTSSTSTASTFLKTAMNEGMDMLTDWLRNDLFAKTNELMSNLTVGVFNVISVVVNFLIGMVISVYLLYSKETFMKQCKKTVYAVFNPRHANMLLHMAMKSNEIFGGFVIGKIVDSAIIGVICFFGLSLLKMPYTSLISVIVGVTNVIPFFGPYIGAVPSAVLIMLANPIKGIYFVIFILLLQQFDGNILGPKILGNSTGLTPFWVVFAILLGGGLFGVAGMLMGVPAFAVIYYLAEMILNSRLEGKNLPVSTDEYGVMSYVDEKGVFVGESEVLSREEEECQDADPSTE